MLLWALEVCNLSKRDLKSLGFTVNRLFMKLFSTKDMSRLVKFESTCDIRFFYVYYATCVVNKDEYMLLESTILAGKCLYRKL